MSPGGARYCASTPSGLRCGAELFADYIGPEDAPPTGSASGGAEGVVQATRQLGELRDIAWGGQHRCVVSAAREVWCWGSRRQGQTGSLPDPAFRRDAVVVDWQRLPKR